MLSEWGLAKEADLFALHEDHGKVHTYIKNMLQPTRVVGDYYLRNAELLDRVMTMTIPLALSSFWPKRNNELRYGFKFCNFATSDC